MQSFGWCRPTHSIISTVVSIPIIARNNGASRITEYNISKVATQPNAKYTNLGTDISITQEILPQCVEAQYHYEHHQGANQQIPHVGILAFLVRLHPIMRQLIITEHIITRTSQTTSCRSGCIQSPALFNSL
jgi:hypothetical protein